MDTQMSLESKLFLLEKGIKHFEVARCIYGKEKLNVNWMEISYLCNFDNYHKDLKKVFRFLQDEDILSLTKKDHYSLEDNEHVYSPRLDLTFYYFNNLKDAVTAKESLYDSSSVKIVKW